MHKQAAFTGDSCHGSNGIHHALRVGGGRSHQQDGVRCNGVLHCLRVGAKPRIQRCFYQAHIEILCCFVESRVRRDRQHDLRVADLGAVGSCPIAGSLHCHEDAFSSAGGHVSGYPTAAAQQTGAHGNDFGLEFAQAGEGRRIQPILREKQQVGLLGDFLDRLVGLKYQAEGFALLPVDVAGAGSAHFFKNFFSRRPLLGNIHYFARELIRKSEVDVTSVSEEFWNVK